MSTLEDLNLPSRESRSREKSQHVHFDEAVIAEHDKDRGTRMTIDEPDTPFARSPLVSESEEDAHHGRGSANFKLDATASPQSGRSEDEHAAFKAKRKAHYNEFKMAKASDASNADSEEDRKSPSSKN